MDGQIPTLLVSDVVDSPDGPRSFEAIMFTQPQDFIGKTDIELKAFIQDLAKRTVAGARAGKSPSEVRHAMDAEQLARVIG